MSARTGSAGLVRSMGLVGMMSVLLMATFVNAQSRPAPALPGTEAGKRVAGWIAAFNTGDDAAMRQYFSGNMAPEAMARRSMEERPGTNRDMRAAFGTVGLRKVVQAGESLVTVGSRHGEDSRSSASRSSPSRIAGC